MLQQPKISGYPPWIYTIKPHIIPSLQLHLPLIQSAKLLNAGLAREPFPQARSFWFLNRRRYSSNVSASTRLPGRFSSNLAIDPCSSSSFCFTTENLSRKFECNYPRSLALLKTLWVIKALNIASDFFLFQLLKFFCWFLLLLVFFFETGSREKLPPSAHTSINGNLPLSTVGFFR